MALLQRQYDTFTLQQIVKTTGRNSATFYVIQVFSSICVFSK